jgi:cytoskeletal protein CcmA (bactofilin family)
MARSRTSRPPAFQTLPADESFHSPALKLSDIAVNQTMKNHLPSRSQRGIATLLFVVFIALGLMTATGAVYKATSGAQKLQHAEHTATQAELVAWAGVEILSKAVEALPVGAELTEGEVTFAGTQPGLSARYVQQQEGLHVFEVVGASAGARSVLRVALRPREEAEPSGSVNLPSGTTLHGTTVIQGDVTYAGSAPRNLYVIDGTLTLQGSVSGLERVCATGDVEVGSSIRVEEVCSNGNVTFRGSATVTSVSARGNVSLQGGATSAIGDIHSNGSVSLAGGSASAGTIRAKGDVSVTGGNARSNEIWTEGSIDWTSSQSASTLLANGNVNYRPSGTSVNTSIDALGNVMVTSAKSVRTKGATTLVGYWGQGVSGRLDSQGLLGGASWGAGGGAVVSSGTVGSIVSPYPGTVRVTIAPGYTVNVNAVNVPEVPVFEQASITVDAYALKSQANLAFLGIDASGNPQVKVSHVNGVTSGNYFIANNPGVGQNFLCKRVSGNNCVEPLIKVCQGQSNSNRCFSYNNGQWGIDGTTMLPWILWFEGDLNVGSGTWPNSFIATGDVTTSGSLKIYSPNYPEANFTCRGQAQPSLALPAWAANGLAATAYATQLCSADGRELVGAAVANIALLAGGYREATFVGGNISLGSSNEVYGSVLAGQYLNTGGNTTLSGSLYSANQGGSTSRTSNRQGGSTTIRPGNGSSAYNPEIAPCMSGCEQNTSRSNVVWAAPL